MTYGGFLDDSFNDVSETMDKGFILAGSTRSFGAGGSDIYIVKTDSMGKEEWSKTFGGSLDDGAVSVKQTTDGGFIITGGTKSYGQSAGTNDAFLIRTDPDGTFQWGQTYGDDMLDVGYDVKETGDGGFIVSGWTNSIGQGDYDYYIFKTGPDGDLEWSLSFGDLSWDWGGEIEPLSSGGYVVAGNTSNMNTGLSDICILRLDNDGNVQWSKSFGNEDGDYSALSVKQTSDGGFVTAGVIDNFFTTGTFDDVYLLKTDSSGNLQWDKAFGGNDDDQGRSVEITSDGGFLIAGETSSFTGLQECLLLKTDVNGTLLWAVRYGGTSNDVSGAGRTAGNGDYVISGVTYSFGSGGSDGYFIRTTANGFSGCNENATILQTFVPATETDVYGYKDSGCLTGSFTPLSAYIVSLDSLLCPQSLPPYASFAASDTILCQGSCISFTDLSGNAPLEWKWSFPGGIPSTDTLQNPVNICYPDPGIYMVTLSVSNTNGADTLVKTGYIQVLQAPLVDAGENISIKKNESAQLNAIASSFVSCTWSPATGLSNPSILNPVANPDSTITYYLTVVDSNGCTATDSVTISMFTKGSLFVPTAFSPNGDGLNEEFAVYGSGVLDFSLHIYNRWGENIFSASGLTGKWNGRHAGREQPVGIYSYRISGTYEDMSPFSERGTFLLIR